MMLEIIGAGWGRTGTTSTMHALELLGYKCHHMSTLEETPGQDALFEKACDDAAFDWESVYSGYTATVDWPGCSFWRELAAAYPQAKILLNVRDVAGWYESWRSTIYQAIVDESPGARPSSWRAMARRVIAGRSLGGEIDRRDHVMAAFEQHIRAVSAAFPPSRLLVFDVRQGWGPLCDFLAKDLPGVPFPRVNVRSEW